MQVTFFGVRGSTPCHGDDTRRYGGNTSCVVVRVPDADPILLDLGTGARYFGRDAEPGFRGACLLSHLHWDHVQGLPFFAPLLRADSTLHLYAPAQRDGRSLCEVIDDAIRPPMFPLAASQLPGELVCHDTEDEEFSLGSVRVVARLVPHIGPTLGYRLEWGGRSIAYLSDHQQPIDGALTVAEGARELVQGVDLLIHDAQFTQPEFELKRHWGHCTIDYAKWLAAECQVGTLALFHHDPTRTDDELDEVGRACTGSGPAVVVAREGLTLSFDRR
jgi:phosphoribosyl 1,2-cyclic phosphodiesterase